MSFYYYRIHQPSELLYFIPLVSILYIRERLRIIELSEHTGVKTLHFPLGFVSFFTIYSTVKTCTNYVPMERYWHQQESYKSAQQVITSACLVFRMISFGFVLGFRRNVMGIGSRWVGVASPILFLEASSSKDHFYFYEKQASTSSKL